MNGEHQMKMSKRQISKDEKYISFSQDNQVKALVKKIIVALCLMLCNLALLFALVLAYPNWISNESLWLTLVVIFAGSYLGFLILSLVRIVQFFRSTS